MFEEELNTHVGKAKQTFTMRDYLAVGFRHRRLITNTFLGVFAIAIVTRCWKCATGPSTELASQVFQTPQAL
jgi:hypothetical protein